MYNHTERPYFSNTISELEAFSDSYWNDGNAIITLAVELFHRKKQRSVALRTKLLERLSELINQGFAWPTTDAEPSNNDSPVFIDAPTTGLLRYLGYRVGSAGLSPEDRCDLLDAVYTNRLPQLNSVEYINEWGEPLTAQRLKKMAESIAAFVRNTKRRQNPPKQAISDWEDDLKYLYTKFYVGTYDFFWPNTSLDKVE